MKNPQKKNSKKMDLKYVFTESADKVSKAYEILFEAVLKARILKKRVELATTFKPGEYDSLYKYYEQQYPVDLEEFKKACFTDMKTENLDNKSFFVQDLDNLRKTNHSLLSKKYFIYFLSIHTALLMEIHKHFNDKYDEFKAMNKGLVFEYGLTNTHILPWEIPPRLHVHFDDNLFSKCLSLAISQLMTSYRFCGIIPQDFMNKFINDPDLNSEKIPYGKGWKERVTEIWVKINLYVCPKK
jgi:hypothetical protein